MEKSCHVGTKTMMGAQLGPIVMQHEVRGPLPEFGPTLESSHELVGAREGKIGSDSQDGAGLPRIVWRDIQVKCLDSESGTPLISGEVVTGLSFRGQTRNQLTCKGPLPLPRLVPAMQIQSIVTDDAAM